MHLRRLIPLLALASLTLAAAAQAQALYWIDTNFNAPTLNKSDALGNAIASVPLAPASLPEGLATDASGKVYWGEAWLSGARINRAAPTLSSITPLSSYGSTLRGVAVDDVAGTIYWTSSNLVMGSRVTRSALDGSGETVLLALGSAANPRGIAVDHVGGKIYWADFDQDVIVQANLDGSSMTQWLFVPANAHPYGVAIDPVARQIYWTEYAGKIRRAPLAGGATVSLLGGLSNPTYLALDPAGGQMYWSEGGAGTQHIYQGPMTGGSRMALALPLTTYGGLAFQPNSTVSSEQPPPVLEFALAPLTPNPSDGRVRAEFALPRESQARLAVIDLQGREVAVLADGRFSAGRHVTYWNPNARRVPAGVYFVRLATDGRAWVRRLVRSR
jgi:DNA-binding beta-propeller fold protein YncE